MKLADLFDHFMIDLDGVVYVGDKPTPGARESLLKLRELGKSTVFLTNDPRGSSHEYSEKLNGMGIEIDPQGIITSSMAVSYFLKEHYETEGKKAFVIGSKALKEEVGQTGLKLAEGGEAKKADFVVVGGHPQTTYEDIKIATLAIRNGARFFGTNRDPFFPTEEGLVPATGALIAAIEVASGTRAITVGKPEPIMFQAGKKVLRSQEKIAMIGDSLTSDIAGGKRADVATILVLTGSAKRDDLSKSEIVPDYVVDDLRSLLNDA